jgi:hypothetical protein
MLTAIEGMGVLNFWLFKGCMDRRNRVQDSGCGMS